MTLAVWVDFTATTITTTKTKITTTTTTMKNPYALLNPTPAYILYYFLCHKFLLSAELRRREKE